MRGMGERGKVWRERWKGGREGWGVEGQGCM